MAIVRHCKSVIDVYEALTDCDDDEAFTRVIPGMVAGVVSFETTDSSGESVILIIEAQDYDPPEREDVVHAHGEHDFHGHTFEDYREHQRPIENERFPPL